ncbi:MAG: hypothetical protein M1827_004825 [Pycnora praestabilis]|nr:MAG: hypothetical protein M1827_004825 [Pycnora praestabilis]
MGRKEDVEVATAYQYYQAAAEDKCVTARCTHCNHTLAKNTHRQRLHLQNCAPYLRALEESNQSTRVSLEAAGIDPTPPQAPYPAVTNSATRTPLDPRLVGASRQNGNTKTPTRKRASEAAVVNQRRTKRRAEPKPMPEALVQAFNDATEPYEDKIEDLQDHIIAVHEQLAEHGYLATIPPNVAEHLNALPNAAETLSSLLNKAIYNRYCHLLSQQAREEETYTSTDFLTSMLTFLPPTKQLSAILPSGPKHAFNILLKLGKYSYGDLEKRHNNSNLNNMIGNNANTDDNRALYRKLDDVMVNICTARLDEGPGWNATLAGEIADIEREKEQLDRHGIGPLFPNTLLILKAFLDNW